MTQKANIYTTQQFNELISGLSKNNTIKVQEILLPPDNIAQENQINITTSKDVNFQGIPSEIAFHIPNEGYINNWNSCITFQIPIEVNLTDLVNNYSGIYSYAQSQKVSMIQNQLKADFVLLDNFICLKLSAMISNENNTVGQYYQLTQYFRLMQIPPSPASWLDSVILQKNNQNNGPLNSYYWDIFRKQVINNQLISGDYTSYKQDNYACIQSGAAHLTTDGNNLTVDTTQNIHNEKLLAQNMVQFGSGQGDVILKYLHQVNIELPYVHPFFQMSNCSPMELLNSELVLTMNFNRHLFSAIYAYDRYEGFYMPNQPRLVVDAGGGKYSNIDTIMKVSFTGINNIKMIVQKDRVLKDRKIEPGYFGKFYITYRASDKIQQKDFPKQGNPVLQNIIPNLASLDIIQMSVYDPVRYTQDGDENCLDYYIGYSNLFNTSMYNNVSGTEFNRNGGQYGNMGFPIQNIYYQDSQLALDLPFITFGNIQININQHNVVPYQYQSLQNIYQNNMSIYDINDNKQPVNQQWNYCDYLSYFNTYLFKFDQQFGSQDDLRSASFQGLKTEGGSSNIYFELYNYNQENPGKVNYQTTQPGMYQNWVMNPGFVEFIYYYSALMMISENGDLITVNEDTAQEIIDAHKQRIIKDEDYKLIDQRIEMILNKINTKKQAEEQVKEEIKVEETVPTENNDMPPL